MVDYCNNYNPLGHFKMTEEEIKSLSNYLADNLEVEAEGDEVALIYCCIKEWEQDGISRASTPAPVERIEGLAVAISKLASSDYGDRPLCDNEYIVIKAARAYLKLQGGE